MKKSEEEESRFTKFTQCSLDTDSLANIFSENIEPELKCLGKSLDLFMDVVRTDEPGSLSLNELKIYIKKNVDDIDESVFDLLDAIFQLNSVILGDSPQYIKRVNVPRLVTLFVEINKAMVDNEVLKFYDEDKKISYKEHNRRKALVFEALSNIGAKINEISIENSNKIDFEDFLSKFHRIDGEASIMQVLKNLPKLLFIKKMFLGGDIKLLNSKELRRLAGMLPDIAKISFDISSLSIIEHSENEEEEILETLSVGVRSLVKNLYYPRGSSEKLMTVTDIFNTAEIFADAPKRFDDNGKPIIEKPEDHISYWFKYKKEFLIAKEILLESDEESFTSNEVFELLNDIAYKNLSTGVSIYQTYRLNKDILDSKQQITKDLPRISDINGSTESFKKMINRIVKNYFFYKGKDPSSKLSREIKRSPLGIVQIALIEDVLERVFKGKARHLLRTLPLKIEKNQLRVREINSDTTLTRDEKKEKINMIVEENKAFLNHLLSIDEKQKEGQLLTQESIVELFNDFSQLLLDNDLVTRKREANTAETITLMTSLFQAQSNGDSYISVPEMTEFAIELLGGMDFADVGQSYYSKKCQNLEPKKGKPARFTPKCFRENFVDYLESEKNDIKLKDQVPGLVKYMSEMEDGGESYLKVSEAFTRSCTHFKDGSPVPYTEGEMLLVFTGMFAVEQTMVRYDINQNNILDEDEVDAAFEVYKPAIEALIPVKALKSKSKDIYRYLMKYKELPDVETEGKGIKGFFNAIKGGAKLVGFIFFKRDSKKRVKADRETIATILKTLAELSPENQKKPFPCELLALDYEDEGK